jgi:ribosomal protein S18 acetylase RimI-like enzyme
VDTWRAAYRGIVPDDYLANLSYEESGRRWLDRLTTDGRGVFVADGHQGIYGFASGRPRQRFSKGLEEHGGELETVYVLPNSQGSGAGRALVAAVAEYLLGRGTTSGLLWVFEENRPARGFYESLGETVLAHDGFELGGVWVREVAYGGRLRLEGPRRVALAHGLSPTVGQIIPQRVRGAGEGQLGPR